MYLISACLAGINCRYDGKNCERKVFVDLIRWGQAVPVCPEQLGGLPVPRPCCEIVTGEAGEKKVRSIDGQDFTKEFIKGAEETLVIARANSITKAILKSNSPSCGCGLVYDGTFSGILIQGNGFAAGLLADNGIKVITEKEINP